MKQTINFTEFTDRFKSLRPNSFSYDGLKALYDYLEQYEEDTGEEIELDVITLCCEYSEYESIKDFRDDYNDECKTIKDIEERTTVIPTSGDGFIIQQF